MRIHFEDHGQDFLWFDLSEEGQVTDAGPFQAWLWKGKVGSIVRQSGKRFFEFEDGEECLRTIHYPIRRVEKVVRDNRRSFGSIVLVEEQGWCRAPIKRENKSRYPSDWAAISSRIRFERAGGRCEFPGCAAVHGQPHPLTGATVILTVAHLDHTPENCADDNLRAGCQRCHNRYDRAHRITTRNAERRSFMMMLPFGEP